MFASVAGATWNEPRSDRDNCLDNIRRRCAESFTTDSSTNVGYLAFFPTSNVLPLEFLLGCGSSSNPGQTENPPRSVLFSPIAARTAPDVPKPNVSRVDPESETQAHQAMPAPVENSSIGRPSRQMPRRPRKIATKTRTKITGRPEKTHTCFRNLSTAPRPDPYRNAGGAVSHARFRFPPHNGPATRPRKSPRRPDRQPNRTRILKHLVWAVMSGRNATAFYRARLAHRYPSDAISTEANRA